MRGELSIAHAGRFEVLLHDTLDLTLRDPVPAVGKKQSLLVRIGVAARAEDKIVLQRVHALLVQRDHALLAAFPAEQQARLAVVLPHIGQVHAGELGETHPAGYKPQDHAIVPAGVFVVRFLDRLQELLGLVERQELRQGLVPLWARDLDGGVVRDLAALVHVLEVCIERSDGGELVLPRGLVVLQLVLTEGEEGGEIRPVQSVELFECDIRDLNGFKRYTGTFLLDVPVPPEKGLYRGCVVYARRGRETFFGLQVAQPVDDVLREPDAVKVGLLGR